MKAEIDKILTTDSNPIKDFRLLNLSKADLNYLLKRLDLSTIHFINWHPDQEFHVEKIDIQKKLIENILADKRNQLVIDLTQCQVDSQYLELLANELASRAHIGLVVLSEHDEQRFEQNENYKRICQIQRENNKIFRRFPSDYVHALLTCHCNNISDQEISEKIKSLGWKKHKIFGIPKEELNEKKIRKKYLSILYKNDETRQMVLAFRGMNLRVQDFFLEEGKLGAVQDGIMSNEITVHSYFARVHSIKALEECKRDNFYLSFTGFSFGAWLAEQSVYFCHVERPGSSVRAVTFESPGSLEIMENMSDSNLANEKTIDREALKYLDVKTFLFAPSFLNTSNQHVGKVFRVFEKPKENNFLVKFVEQILLPAVPWKLVRDILEKWFKTIVKDQISKYRFYLNGLRALFMQDLKWLVDEFDSIGHNDKSYRFPMEVESWPKIVFEPKDSHNALASMLPDDLLSKYPKMAARLGFKFGMKYFVSKYLFSVAMILNFLCEIFISDKFNNDQFSKCLEFDATNTIEIGNPDNKEYSNDDFMLKFVGHYSVRKSEEFNGYLWLSDPNYVDARILAFHEKCERFQRGPLNDLIQSFRNQYEIKTNGENVLKWKITSRSELVTVEQIREQFIRLEKIYKVCEERSICFRKRVEPIVYVNQPIISKALTTIGDDFGGIRSITLVKSEQFISKLSKLKQLLMVDKISCFAYVYGRSGNGKTTLVREFAYDLKNEKQQLSVQFIVSRDLSSNLIEICKRLSISDETRSTYGKNEEEMIVLIKNSLRTFAFQMLIIFDNVVEIGQIKLIINSLSNEQMFFLITTKHHRMFSEIDPQRKLAIKMNSFSRKECFMYLEQFVDVAKRRDDWNKLINECLSLNVSRKDFENGIAYFCTHRINCTFKILLELIKNEGFIRLNTVKSENPRAFDVLLHLAFLDGNILDWQSVKLIAKFEDVDVALNESLGEILDYLINSGYLKETRSDYLMRSFEMHERIQRQVRAYAIKEDLKENILTNILDEFIKKIRKNCDENENNFVFIENISKHIIEIKKYIEANSRNINYQSYKSLVRYLATINVRNLLNDNEGLQLLKIYKELLLEQDDDDADEEETEWVSHEMGQVYLDQGKYTNALKFLNESLEIDERQIPQDEASISITKASIGQVYFCLGENSVALRFLNESLELQKRQKPKNETGIAIMMQTIAQVYLSQGNYTGALKLLQKSLKKQKQQIPQNERSIAITKQSIGQVYFEQGKYASAVKIYNESLRLQEQQNPKDERGIAATMAIIARAYLDQGKYKDALELFTQSLDKQEQQQNLPKDERSIAATMANIGRVRLDRGEYKDALQLLTKSRELEMLQIPQDENRISLISSLIGQVYFELGCYDLALEHVYVDYVNIQRRMSSQDMNPIDLEVCSHKIARIRFKKGNFEDLIKLCEQFEKSAFYSNPCIYANLFIQFGELKFTLGLYSSAITDRVHLFESSLGYFKKAFAIYQHYLPTHPSIGVIYRGIGRVLAWQKKYQEALENLEKSLSTTCANNQLPTDHPTLAVTLTSIGEVYLKQNKLEMAEEKFNESLAMTARCLIPNDHPVNGETLFAIGRLYRKQGKRKKALEKLQKALEIFQSKLDPNHPIIENVEKYLNKTKKFTFIQSPFCCD